jgi:hypothetical protein
MSKLNTFLTILAILSVLFLVLFINGNISRLGDKEYNCYNKNTLIYETKINCKYNGNEWICEEGKYKYCFE